MNTLKHDDECESGTAAEPETWAMHGAGCRCDLRQAIAEGKAESAEYRERIKRLHSPPLAMDIKQTFDDAHAEAEEITAVLYRSHCRSFRQGAQECREMLARFVEQGGDAITAASIRANWSPSWGPDPGPLKREEGPPTDSP